MSFAIVIPAQETNKYHNKGDLAPFGDTTLLEWKISQCKEFADSTQIYISASSDIIKNIAEKEEVNYIERISEINYIDMILQTLDNIYIEDIIWLNSSAPFIDSKIYLKMYKKFKNENLNSLVSVERKKEYVFFKEQKLNFSGNFISRKDIEPIYIMTNGCYIVKRNIVIKNKNLISLNPSFFEIDSFASIEIKDVNDYSIARDLISIYFRKEFDV